MTLEEEKQLVLKELKISLTNDWDAIPAIVAFQKWNPHESRQPWDEIWKNMPSDMFNDYIRTLLGILYNDDFPNYSIKFFLVEVKKAHTAPPELCWKALIRVLKRLEEDAQVQGIKGTA